MDQRINEENQEAYWGLERSTNVCCKGDNTDRKGHESDEGLLTLIQNDPIFQEITEAYSCPLKRLSEVQLYCRKWATIHNICAAYSPIRLPQRTFTWASKFCNFFLIRGKLCGINYVLGYFMEYFNLLKKSSLLHHQIVHKCPTAAHDCCYGNTLKTVVSFRIWETHHIGTLFIGSLSVVKGKDPARTLHVWPTKLDFRPTLFLKRP